MSRTRRYQLVCALTFFTVASVSCQTQIHGFTGHGVLLPCVYTGSDPLPEKVTAFWRDKDNKNILDIKSNVPDTSSQSQEFRGRVNSFPDVYVKGNFSIFLNELQLPDSGVYDCDILTVEFKQTVLLAVSDKPAVKGTTVTPRLVPTATEPSGAAAGTVASVCLTLLCVSVSL